MNVVLPNESRISCSLRPAQSRRSASIGHSDRRAGRGLTASCAC
jgi:hypothetical protein